MDKPGDSSIERRALGNDDIALLGDLAVGTAKVGIIALGLLQGNPEAAVALALASEYSGVLLARQKERCSHFLVKWRRRVDQLPAESTIYLRQNLLTDSGERLFEETWHAAASAVDPEKLDYLAEMLVNGLSSSDLEAHQTHRVLQLIEALDAVDFIILQGDLQQNRFPELRSLPSPEAELQRERASRFREKHAAIFAGSEKPDEPQRPREYQGAMMRGFAKEKPMPPLIQAEWEEQLRAYQRALEKYALFQSRLQRLVEIGLMGLTSFGHGDSSLHLTPLGMALLKITGLAPLEEWAEAQATGAMAIAQQITNNQNVAARESFLRRAEQQRQEEQAARELEKGVKDFVREVERRLG